jgi:DNA-binding response OmpR family regulator
MSHGHILVAEDDRAIRLGLIDALESEGYDVVPASDGHQALDLFPQQDFDLVLLDVMMPKLSGYDVCRALRKKDPRVPIVMLTAKGEEIDKVVGLELGADDYVTKPFGVRELMARIAAQLRRSRTATASAGDDLPDELAFGPAVINRKRYTCVQGKESQDLTAREMKLVEALYRRAGDVVSRDDLLNEVWGIDYDGTTRTLDQHIAQLRKKVGPATIETVHGVGYRFRDVS